MKSSRFFRMLVFAALVCFLPFCAAASSLSLASNWMCQQAMNGGVIDTIAGTSAQGGAGDGGAAISAQLSFPYDVAVDADGNVFVLDYGNASVRKIDSSGTIQTIAGNGSNGYSGDGGLAVNAQLNRPHGLCVDGLGSLYIADTYNNCIRKIDANGVITTVAGNGEDGYSGDGGSALNAKLNKPYGVFKDAAGNLFIADTSNHVVRKVDSSGVITTVAGSVGFGYSGDDGSANQAKLRTPIGVFVDSKGELFIADTGNNVIRKVNGDGIIQTIAGNGLEGYSGDGGDPTRAKLAKPSSIVVDGSGLVLIADSGNHAIRAIAGDGNLISVAGNGTAGYFGDGMATNKALLNFPSGLAVNDKNEIYLADTRNHRIRKMGAPSSVYVYAGEDRAVSIGEGVQLRSIVGGVEEPYQVGWQIESGPDLDLAQISNAGIENPVFAPSTLGEYVLVLTVSDGNQVASDSVTITVKGLFDVSAGKDVVIVSNQSVQLKGSVSGTEGESSVEWSILSGPNVDGGQLSQTDVLETEFTPALAGTYTIQLKINDSILGTVLDSIAVVVLGVNPQNSVFVTDSEDTLIDLSDFYDFDPVGDMKLVVRWNFDSNKVNFSNVSDVHVYVRVNEQGMYQYLGHTGRGDVSYLTWAASPSENINQAFQSGPQDGNQYEFQAFFLSKNGNPVFYGPYQNKGPVDFRLKSDPADPDPIVIPTARPTEIASEPTNTSVPRATPTPTIGGVVDPTQPPNHATPGPDDPNQPNPTAAPTNPSGPTAVPGDPTPGPGEKPTVDPSEPGRTPTKGPNDPGDDRTPQPTDPPAVDPTLEPEATPTNTPTPLPETVTMIGIVRDFNHNHPDFERYVSSRGEKGIVEETLGLDKKPVLAAGKHDQITSEGSFKHWFEDNPGQNERTEIEIELRLDPNSPPIAPVYAFESSSFFPIDNQLMGNQGRNHNFHFTMEIHTKFTYTGPQEFKFSGDDDVWVFINNKLVIDLGGVHPELKANVNTGDLGLEIGQTYPLDLFFAERHTTGSNFRISTGLYLKPAPLPEPTATPTPEDEWQPEPTPEPTSAPQGPEIEVGPLTTSLYYVDDAVSMDSMRALSSASIVIENVGTGVLSIYSLALEREMPWLKVTTLDPFALAPGQSRELIASVDWEQMPLGNYSNRLLIDSNGSNENPYPSGVYINLNKAAPTPTPVPSEPTAPIPPTSVPTPDNTPVGPGPGEPTYTPTSLPGEVNTPTPGAPVNPGDQPTVSPQPTEAESTPSPEQPTAVAGETPMPGEPTQAPDETHVPATPTVTPVAGESTPTPDETPSPDQPTQKPGGDVEATPTPTVTPTLVSEPTPTPTLPIVGDPTLYHFFSFNGFSQKKLSSYQFTSTPSNAGVTINRLPLSSGKVGGPDTEGLICPVPQGELLTLNGPEITVFKNPASVSVWYYLPTEGYQFALGAYGEIDGQNGSSFYTVRNSPEYKPGQWQKAEIIVSGNYTSITPFVMIYNESGVFNKQNQVYIDSLAVAQGRTILRDETVVPGEWKANQWISPSEEGMAYQQNSELVLEKDPTKSISRFVSSFSLDENPIQVTVEMDVVKDYGESGVLTLWLGTGPNANQIDVPLWMLKAGEAKTLTLSSVSLAEADFTNVVVQVAGQDAQRVRIPDVRIYRNEVDPRTY